MKLKIDWKALGKALWNAVKPVLLGAIGGGVIALTDGCSSLTPSSKTQSMGVYAIGVPGIAIICPASPSSRSPRRTRTPPAAMRMRRRRRTRSRPR